MDIPYFSRKIGFEIKEGRVVYGKENKKEGHQ